MTRDRLPPPLGEPVPLIDLEAVHGHLRNEFREAFERVLDSSNFSAGAEVAAFEEALAARTSTSHAVGVASGTAALHLALLAAGIGPGDEVIVPANTFFATAEAAFAAGATPVLVDVRRDTAGIDPEAVRARIGPRTTAVVAVHLYGVPADVDALEAVTSRHGLLLIEDAAQALGARWDGRPVGSLGNAAAFSFYPTKNVGALGEAGAVTTDDAALAERIALLRAHGEREKNVHVVAGYNERLDELQAAFLRVKLAHIDEDLHRRTTAAAYYRQLLDDVPGARLLDSPPVAEPARHLLVVCVERRDEVLASLREYGVGAAVHYPTPLHLQPACAHLGMRAGDLPNAEELARSTLSLPFYPGITEGQTERSVDALAAAIERTEDASLK